MDIFKRDCQDCIHFNPERLQDENKHHCLKWLKCSANLGCSYYEEYQVVDIEPIIAYNDMVFLDVEELHQWKIKNLWNGIDIAVTEDDIRW